MLHFLFEQREEDSHSGFSQIYQYYIRVDTGQIYQYYFRVHTGQEEYGDANTVSGLLSSVNRKVHTVYLVWWFKYPYIQTYKVTLFPPRHVPTLDGQSSPEDVGSIVRWQLPKKTDSRQPKHAKAKNNTTLPVWIQECCALYRQCDATVFITPLLAVDPVAAKTLR